MCEHVWHFVEIDDINDNKIENDICTSTKRIERYVTFVCEKCGELNKILTADKE